MKDQIETLRTMHWSRVRLSVAQLDALFAEIDRLRELNAELAALVQEFVDSDTQWDDDPIDGEPLKVRARAALAKVQP